MKSSCIAVYSIFGLEVELPTAPPGRSGLPSGTNENGVAPEGVTGLLISEDAADLVAPEDTPHMLAPEA